MMLAHRRLKGFQIEMIAKKLWIATLILLGVSITAAAQPSSPAGKPNPHIKSKFNKSKNVTTVTLKTLSLSNSMNREFTRESEAGQLELDVSFSYPGEQLTKPAAEASLTFKSTQKNQIWQKGQNVVAIVNDETALVIGQSNYKSNSQTFYFEELMTVSIPYETMKKIAEAKTLRFQLGTRNISIKDDQLQDLRDLVAMMAP
jgi:hypothetical protein